MDITSSYTMSDCARFKAERDALAQRMEEIASEIDRTLSGVEGIEDAPAMRWMRGLREALGSLHSPRTSYEDIESAKWVREHGGLERVNLERDQLYGVLRETCDLLDVSYFGVWTTDAQSIWRKFDWYKARLGESVPRSYAKRRIASRQRQIDESHAALRRRNARIAELEQECDELREMVRSLNALTDEMEKRLMPEGMEWPRYEDGEPVSIGDVVSDVEVRSMVFREDGILLSDCTSVPGWGTWRSYKEPIKRPAPKVLDADSVQIRVGDTVYLLPGDWCDKFPCYGYHGNEELEVFSLHADHVEGGVGCRDTRRPKGTCYPQPSQLTHERPVIAGDGRPLREGETVWSVDSGTKYTVEKVTDGLIPIKCCSEMGSTVSLHPSQLTHERPDSWERWREEWQWPPCRYCKLVLGVEYDHDTQLQDAFDAQGEDLERRAKALAGVSG